MVNNMMYLVKLVKMTNYILDSLITMMAQYALQLLQNVVIDDFEIWTRDTYTKIKIKIIFQKLHIWYQENIFLLILNLKNTIIYKSLTPPTYVFHVFPYYEVFIYKVLDSFWDLFIYFSLRISHFFKYY